jgi:hypothetical protein
VICCNKKKDQELKEKIARNLATRQEKAEDEVEEEEFELRKDTIPSPQSKTDDHRKAHPTTAAATTSVEAVMPRAVLLSQQAASLNKPAKAKLYDDEEADEESKGAATPLSSRVGGDPESGTYDKKTSYNTVV